MSVARKRPVAVAGHRAWGSYEDRAGATINPANKPKFAFAQESLRIVIERMDRCGHYTARLPSGEIITSRQPMLDCARALLARDYHPRLRLEMRRRGKKDWDLRAEIGVAAKLTVDEHGDGIRFAKWKPFSRPAVSSRIAQTDLPLVEGCLYGRPKI